LAGCTKDHKIELWNNTGSAVTIAAADETLVIQPGSKGTFGWLWPGEQFTVQMGGTKIILEYQPPPRHFLDETVTATTYKLQINSDGFVYVLDPWTKAVAQHLPEQPPGFPLKQKKEEPLR